MYKTLNYLDTRLGWKSWYLLYSLLISIWMDWTEENRRELNSWRTKASHTLKSDTHMAYVSKNLSEKLIENSIILWCMYCDPSPLTWNLLIASVLKEAQLNENIVFITERIHRQKLRRRRNWDLPARRQTKVDSLAVVWITPPPSEPCKSSALWNGEITEVSHKR